MKKQYLLLATMLFPSFSFAQSIPDWKSYMATGNPVDIVPSAGTANSVSAWMGKKVDINNGKSTNQTLESPTVSDQISTPYLAVPDLILHKQIEIPEIGRLLLTLLFLRYLKTEVGQFGCYLTLITSTEKRLMFQKMLLLKVPRT